MLKNKIFWKIFKATSIGFIGIPFLSACLFSQNSDTIIFANYQSYMAPKLEVDLREKYNVQFDSFSVAEEVPSRYRTNSFDSSVVSSSVLSNLIRNDLVVKFDWTQFNITNKEGKIISSAQEALELFTPAVQSIVTTSFQNSSGENINLLDYGIPYFLQTFNFAYRGKKIIELHPKPNEENVTTTETLDNKINPTIEYPSWKKMLNTISKEQRFHSSKKPNLGMILDSRTIFAVSNLMNSESQYSNNLEKINVNPTNQRISIQEAQNIYGTWAEYGINRKHLGINPILLNSDSNAIINEIADENSAQSLQGAFMYNGDALYAASGGDVGSDVSYDDFHIVKNNYTTYALDLINISSKVTKNKKERLYEMIKDLALAGSSFVKQEEKSNTQEEGSDSNSDKWIEEDILATVENNEEEYNYGPMINFDFVNYTPVLNTLYRKILGIGLEEDEEELVEEEAKEETENAVLKNNIAFNETQVVEMKNGLDTIKDPTFEEVKNLYQYSYFYDPLANDDDENNTASLKNEAKLKAWLLMQIYIINDIHSVNKTIEQTTTDTAKQNKSIISQFVEQSLNALQRSNISIAFNSFKIQNW